MFYATIFQLNDQVSVIHPSFSSLDTCLGFLTQFITKLGPDTIGVGCLSYETLVNMGIVPI
jgi:hypothetical protein